MPRPAAGPHPPRLPAQRGAALLLVLWALVLLITAIGLAAGRGDRTVAQAIALDEALQAEQGLFSTREAVLYLLTSRRLNIGGLPLARHGIDTRDPAYTDAAGTVPWEPRGDEFALDASVQAGLDQARWALQDHSGLFNPNFDPALFEELLQDQGLAASIRRRLLATLAAYTAPADQPRVFRAAAARDYTEAGLPPPAHRALLVPAELARLPGWAKALPGAALDALLTNAGTLRYRPLNINTAPAAVLQAELGISRRQARELINARPLSGIEQMERLLATTLRTDWERVITAPGPFQRLSLWPANGSAAQVWEIEIQPTADGKAPWRIHARYRARTPASATEAAPRSDWDEQRAAWQPAP